MNALTFPFPPSEVATAAIPDKAAALAPRVAAALARLVPGADIAAGVTVATADDADIIPVAMRRSDGLHCAVVVARALAEALASVQLGGSFSTDAEAAETLSPSVRRAQQLLVEACLEAVDKVWPTDTSHWQAASGKISGTRLAIAVRAPALEARIDFTVSVPDEAAAPSAAASPRTEIAWARGMRALLGATGLPLRAVLHERQLPLAQAVQLAPGDVLPIEAPRDVLLRIGTHRIARGTITPLGDEGALLVTITSRRPDPATLASLEEPS